MQGLWRYGTRLVIGGLLMGLLAGCGMMESRTKHRASSVVDFLYPKGNQVAVKPSVPRLALPLSVGVAFVPSGESRHGSRVLDPNLRMQIMERVAGEFRQYEFIDHIELIPTEYLRPGGSFDNLQQLKTMYGIDVIALISYDQIQNTDQSFWSVAYWTIVGAYIFEGERNDTSTLIDAAVFDIDSRKLLFRAPGTSQVKASATIVNLSEALREDSQQGFELAADNLVVNLTAELERFKMRIRERPEEVQVTHREGYSGGGGVFGGLFALLLVAVLGLRVRNRQ